ncbi:MAG TPA: hypothetical protein PKA64_25510 [Myxococcota bacterium]|nr:hypothetical protein [Myxococcota bacterium]
MELGARVRAEVDCAESPWRWLCAIAEVREGAVPAATTARLGLVLAFRPSQPVLLSAERTATLGLLVVGPERVGFDLLRPTERVEPQELAKVAGPIAASLRGGGDGAPLLPPIAGPLLALDPVDAGPLEADGQTFHTPPDAKGTPHEARLYHLDAAGGPPMWVAVKGYGEGGYVGVFPDVDPRILKRDAPPDQATP